MNLTQQRFYGFLNTPFLWNKELLGLQQFDLHDPITTIAVKIPDTIRLGNYVEQLLSYQLHQSKQIQVLKEHTQIIQHKETLGEIDCLLVQNKIPIHLEVAYKFYLYDASVGNTFLEHWIGPNRRDSLILKLNKIKEKQFPLLYSEACKPLLDELNLTVATIQQQTFFKAQLFVSYGKTIEFPKLNPACVQGYYVAIEQLETFKACKFYIPKKLDWLITPHTQVAWMGYEAANKRILEFHQQDSSPLCWVKQPNGELIKLFVTCW